MRPCLEDLVYNIAHCGADISSAQAARLTLRYQDVGEGKDK